MSSPFRRGRATKAKAEPPPPKPLEKVMEELSLRAEQIDLTCKEGEEVCSDYPSAISSVVYNADAGLIHFSAFNGTYTDFNEGIENGWRCCC